MKYLKNRDRFITDVKKTGMVPYVHDVDVERIDEAFQNDITWGDSLIGRLINSVVRKAKIGVNLVRIDSVIKRMNAEFERLISDAVISNMKPESKIKLYKFIMITLVGELEKVAAAKEDWVISDKNEKPVEVEDVEEVINMTDSTTQSVKDYFDTLKNPSLGLPKEEIDELTKDSDDLVNALTKFSQSLKEIKGEKSEEPGDEEPEKVEAKKELVYSDVLKNNFSLVYDIVCDYNSIVISSKSKTTSSNQKPALNPENLEPGQTQPVSKQNSGYEYLVEAVSGIDPSFVQAIKPLHSYFKSYNFQLPKDEEKRQDEFKKWIDANANKDSVTKVYKSILLIKENNQIFQQLLSKPETLGKHIYNLYKYTKTKANTAIPGFTNEDNLKKVRDFNMSMEQILKTGSSEPKMESEIKKESLLVTYSSYIKMIREADEEKSSSWIVKVNESWKNTFLADFENYNKYVLTREEQDKLKVEVDKSEKTTKSVKIITDRDPVIEIVRLFNRAYRLHTPGSIPSGRTDGAVSNKTFREYEYVGGSSAGTPDTPGAGPYRNIAIFSKWQDAVYDIIGSARYRAIFNKDSTIQVGDGDPIEGFGKKLLDFMNELLDNSKMYNAGAQQKFIKDYFDIETKSSNLNLPEYKEDGKKNEKTAGGQKNVELLFEEVDEIQLTPGAIIKFVSDKEDWYGWVFGKAESDKVWIKFSKNGKFIGKYLPGGVKFKESPVNRRDDDVLFTKVSEKIKSPSDLELLSPFNITKHLKDNKNEKLETIELKSVKFWIAKKKDGDKTESWSVEKPQSFLMSGSKNADSNKGTSGWPELWNKS